MKIEKIERSRHKAGRVLVFVEGGGILRITEEELLHFALRPGMTLDATEEQRLRDAAAASNTRALAAEMIGRRALSRQALLKKLAEKGASEGDALDAADWLAQIGALDDAAYGAALARRCAANGYGTGRIRDELYRHGVPRELWADAMEELPPADAAVEDFIRRRLRGAVPDGKELKRISDALLRRGFRWEEIRPALRRYQEMPEED